jgi:hypothetical protein
MRLLRARFTLRQMMAVVAVVGVALWAGRMLWLSAGYREKARRYPLGLLGATPILMGPHGVHSLGYRRPDRVRWEEAMAENYLRAARYPWLPVEPDPPEPR